MGYAAEGKVVCGVAESCAGMGCSYRNHYQWMGEERQDGDAGLPLDCTPTPVPTPMPTPQPMRTSRKKGTRRSYRNHYQWMGEECQDGDAGLPLDCTPRGLLGART